MDINYVNTTIKRMILIFQSMYKKVNAKGYIQHIIMYVKNLNMKYIVKHVYICHKRIKT